jgi:hypothetical protein
LVFKFRVRHSRGIQSVRNICAAVPVAECVLVGGIGVPVLVYAVDRGSVFSCIGELICCLISGVLRRALVLARTPCASRLLRYPVDRADPWVLVVLVEDVVASTSSFRILGSAGCLESHENGEDALARMMTCKQWCTTIVRSSHRIS